MSSYANMCFQCLDRFFPISTYLFLVRIRNVCIGKDTTPFGFGVGLKFCLFECLQSPKLRVSIYTSNNSLNNVHIRVMLRNSNKYDHFACRQTLRKCTVILRLFPSSFILNEPLIRACILKITLLSYEYFVDYSQCES